MMIVTWGWGEAEASTYILEVELTCLVGEFGIGGKERAIFSDPSFLARSTY